MEIESFARLHLSLIDLNGHEGRLDGGIGLTLKEPSLKISCVESDENSIKYENHINIQNKGLYSSKIMDATNQIKKYLKIDTNYSFNIKELYPIHQGLGLGTQLALSIAKLITSINDKELTVYELATIIQRGGTSGIGVYSFEKGGLIIDGGHKKSVKKDYLPSSASKVSPPPLLARYDFPEDWNILLISPDIPPGASGSNEVNIFQSFSPIKLNDVERISYLTLMKLMPAIIEKDIESFGDAVHKIQLLGFKKIERDLQDSKINYLIKNMEELGIPCVGMSSFGPTCFGITDDNPNKYVDELKEIAGNDSKIIITKGNNHGFKLR